MNEETELKEKAEELRVKTEVIKEHHRKNPTDPQKIKWQKEFLAAQKVVVEKENEAKLGRLSKSFYDTDLESIEEDFEALYDDNVSLSYFNQKPIAISPYSYLAKKSKNNLLLTQQQKDFCEVMRRRVVVVMSHYASERDLLENKVSSLAFGCSLLPDSNHVERWLLPSHKPISIPLYIIRHFGCMSSCKKMPIFVSEEIEDKNKLLEDPMFMSEGFGFGYMQRIQGTQTFIKFVLLSQIKQRVAEASKWEG